MYLFWYTLGVVDRECPTGTTEKGFTVSIDYEALDYVGGWTTSVIAGELGRWLGVGERSVTTSGHAEDVQVGSASVIALAYEIAGGGVNLPVVEAELCPGNPLTPAEARELAAVLIEAADSLDRLSVAEGKLRL